MAKEELSGIPEPLPRTTHAGTPPSLNLIIEHAGDVERAYGDDQDFQERILYFTKQTKTIRIAYETGLLKADEHDKLQGVLMAEMDRGQEIDELTDIYRKLAFLRRLDEQVALAKRNGTPLTVAFLDLDKFGEINKKYSHMHGDAVINQVSHYLKSEFKRGSDILGRYGGEEIAIIMPNTDEISAFKLLHNINKNMSPIVKDAVAGMELIPQLSPRRKVTASIGIAQVFFTNEPGEDPQRRGLEALRRADDRMNLAKKHGRNRVVDSYWEAHLPQPQRRPRKR